MSIALNHITLSYGSRTLLEDVTAAFAQGSLTALIGRNGTGKSTLLRAIAGLGTTVSGDVALCGRPLASLTPHELSTTVGFVTTDKVRIANLGRWALHSGYLSEEEMWQVMQVAADAAREHFASWEEYGRSFAMGRGVWHGDEEDCQTAWEIVTALLEEETSPWRQIAWNA